MPLTPPKQITFWVAIVLGVAGLLGSLGFLAPVAAYAFWLVFFGLVVLALGVMVENL